MELMSVMLVKDYSEALQVAKYGKISQVVLVPHIATKEELERIKLDDTYSIQGYDLYVVDKDRSLMLLQDDKLEK